MLVQHKRYDDRVRSLHYLIQSSRAKQGDDPPHKMNFSADNHSYVNVLQQMKLTKDRAVRGALIIH